MALRRLATDASKPRLHGIHALDRILEMRLALFHVIGSHGFFRYNVPGFAPAARETLILSREHLAERCALFVLICLGDTILTTGRNTVEHMDADLTFPVFCSAFVSRRDVVDLFSSRAGGRG